MRKGFLHPGQSISGKLPNKADTHFHSLCGVEEKQEVMVLFLNSVQRIRQRWLSGHQKSPSWISWDSNLEPLQASQSHQLSHTVINNINQLVILSRVSILPRRALTLSTDLLCAHCVSGYFTKTLHHRDSPHPSPEPLAPSHNQCQHDTRPLKNLPTT